MDAVPHTCLLTVDDLRSGDLGALIDSETDNVVRSILMGVTRRIEGDLHRSMIVRPYWQQSFRWARTVDEGGAARWMATADAWPVVEPVTDGYQSGRRDSQLVSSASAPAVAEYFAGYRREDQDLESLQAESELEGLTTLPPVLPYDIREAALVIALFRVGKRENGTYGMAKKMQEIGGMGPITVEVAEDDFEERILAQLAHHRKMLV